MNKVVLTLLAAGVAVAALLVLWFSLDAPQRGTTARASSEDSPRVPEVLAAVAEDARAEEPVELKAAPLPTLASPPAPADERRAVDGPETGRTLTGQVLAPSAAPADDSLRVIALEESLSPQLVYGTGGVLGALAGDRNTGKKTNVAGTARVGADGRFSLSLPSSAQVWLAVDGRFLYSPRVQAAPADQASVDLTVELGGCLAGTVRLPAGSADAPALLEKLGVELGLDSTEFSTAGPELTSVFQRHAQVNGEGRFELRALPHGRANVLTVDSEDFAQWKKVGLEFTPGAVLEVEVALRHGATLRGFVRDEQGAAIADAAVLAAESGMFGFPGNQLASTTTDASGAFTLAHVAPGKSILLARHEGHLESDAQKLELDDEQQHDGLLLTLASGAAITGRVRFPDGTPAPAGEVAVSFDPEAMVGMGALNAARGGKGKAKCADDGTFEVHGLGKGPFVVSASQAREGGSDPWRAKASGVKADTHDLELTLVAPCELAGRVVDLAGAPVTAFHVQLTAPGATFFARTTRDEAFEDPEGEFLVHGLDAGTWKVVASAKEFGPALPLELVLPRVEQDPLVLTLAPAASVAGTVLDPSGAPLSAARVTLQVDTAARMQQMQSPVEPPKTTSLDDGTFLLEGLGAGTSSVVAAHEGFAASTPVSVEVNAGERATDIVLRLRKGALVTGEVYGGDGKPAAGAQIIAQDASRFDTNLKRTDGEGKFRLENLTPGSWTITAVLDEGGVDANGEADDASAAFLQNMRFTMLELADGEEKHVVLGAPPKDPVLVRGQVLHGKEPVENGLVSFFAEGAKGLEQLKMSPLGAQGRYEAKLGAPGKYLVSVQVNGTGGAFQQHNIEFRETIPDGEEYTLDLALPLGGVKGAVRGPDQKPLAGVRVTLVTEGGVEMGSMMGGQYSESASDEDGHYVFDYLRPGTYSIAAGGALFGGAFGSKSNAGRMVHGDLRVEEGRMLDGIDFELAESSDITGTVVDAGGAPIKDAAIFVRDSSGRPLDRFSMITSGADGSFQYTGVASGAYQVSARGKGLASADSAPVQVRPGEKASVQLVLYPGTTLLIEVVDEEGEHVDAQVSVLDAHGRPMQGMLGMAEISSSFSQGFNTEEEKIGPLPPGSYTVTAVAADGKKTSKPVNLDGQPERRLKLRLR